MTITANIIRNLAARSEGTKLDFKRDDYDWDNDGNLELAKDLMAIANSIPPGGEPGYILIGIAEGTGDIVGIAKHLDDASLHQKVSSILNRTPNFSYSAVDVDGHSVGVYEIRPGQRPFFALRERGKGKLPRYIALYRNGSATEHASPDQVIEWSREDDPITREVRELEAEKLRSELELRPLLGKQGPPTQHNAALLAELYIENQGQRNIIIKDHWCEARLTDQFTRTFPAPPAHSIGRTKTVLGWSGRVVESGARKQIKLRVETEDMIRLLTDASLPRPSTWNWVYVSLTVFVLCESGGRETTVSCSVR